MSDYPSQSPWGPHGPQVSVPSTMPNPTAPSSFPNMGGPDPYAAPAAPSYGGGGGGSSAGGGGYVGRGAYRTVSTAGWMGRLALTGLALGTLLGLVRGAALHVPPAMLGMVVLRLGVAGAAAGAGIPPAVRAFGVALRAAVWIAIAAACWIFAMAAAGQLGWLSRLR